mgnify:CR=1 FL=1
MSIKTDFQTLFFLASTFLVVSIMPLKPITVIKVGNQSKLRKISH